VEGGRKENKYSSVVEAVQYSKLQVRKGWMIFENIMLGCIGRNAVILSSP